MPTDVYFGDVYSIAFWIRVNQLQTETILRMQRSDYTNSFYIFLLYTLELQVSFSSTANMQYIITDYTLPLTQWVHIGFTMSSSLLLTLYVNGGISQRFQFSISKGKALHDMAFIGDGDVSSQPLYATLDDMMFFNRALTDSEMVVTMDYSMSSVVDPSLVTTSAPATTKLPSKCPEGFVGSNCDIGN